MDMPAFRQAATAYYATKAQYDQAVQAAEDEDPEEVQARQGAWKDNYEMPLQQYAAWYRGLPLSTRPGYTDKKVWNRQGGVSGAPPICLSRLQQSVQMPPTHDWLVLAASRDQDPLYAAAVPLTPTTTTSLRTRSTFPRPATLCPRTRRTTRARSVPAPAHGHAALAAGPAAHRDGHADCRHRVAGRHARGVARTVPLSVLEDDLFKLMFNHCSGYGWRLPTDRSPGLPPQHINNGWVLPSAGSTVRMDTADNSYVIPYAIYKTSEFQAALDADQDAQELMDEYNKRKLERDATLEAYVPARQRGLEAAQARAQAAQSEQQQQQDAAAAAVRGEEQSVQASIDAVKAFHDSHPVSKYFGPQYRNQKLLGKIGPDPAQQLRAQPPKTRHRCS